MSISLITEGIIGGGGGDSTPPGIAASTPTPNTTPGAAGGMSATYAIARATPIVVQITDTDGATNLSYVAARAVFLDGTTEPIYNGSSFVGEYVLRSSASSITNGIQLSILREDYWPGAVSGGGNLAVGIAIDAVDAGGNVASTTFYYQMSIAIPVQPTPPVVAVTPTATDIANEMISRIIWQFRS